MSKLIGTVPILALCVLAAAVPPARAFWITDGTALCTATGEQRYPMIASDGSGGAIVTWADYRGVSFDIYVQRVNAYGAVQWTADGAALCTGTGNQSSPKIVSDGSGGAIVTWPDDRSGNYDIYAQCVNASGVVQWTPNGVAICSATGDQTSSAIISDDSGGAIVTWRDYRNGNYDIYVQRVNASGAAQWKSNGLPLCSATGSQLNPMIVGDGSGGAIVTWYDNRSGNYDIYAQCINASGAVQWTADGVALCSATGDQTYPTIVSDDSGGAILTWRDYRSGNYDIYAQRVNASGTIQWAMDGVALCTATGAQIYPVIVTDGSNGAIVTWYDSRSGNNDIYAQRVNASGAVQWTADGTALCTAAGNQHSPAIVTDGLGGAIVTWTDLRGETFDIYAQRVNDSGAVQWTADGVALCTATEDQNPPTIAADGSGGAIVTWQDLRDGIGDIYAELIDALGRAGVHEPAIAAVTDIPGDQGGSTRIRIARSLLDDPLETLYPVISYNVWKRIDSPLFAPLAEGEAAGGTREVISGIDCLSGWPIEEIGGRRFVSSRDLELAGGIPSGTWEIIGSFAACQLSEYYYRAVTDADSTAGGIPYSVYFVSAHTTTPSVWFASDPDSGFSVDNLAPAIPLGLEGEQSYVPEGLSLTWTPNAEDDLAGYFVYRGLTAEFVPEPSNRVASTTGAGFFDDTWDWSAGYHYKVSAVDAHDNESDFALLEPEGVTGSETPEPPAAAYLTQNFPNPFNPATKIAFGLSAPGHVSLRIYDVSGRLVRELVDEMRPAAHYEEVWDGRDGARHRVASGVYFYRLEAGTFTETRKMILLR